MTITELLVKPYFRLLPENLAAVLAAAVWGQKQYLTAYQYEIFQKTGLLHLLVLSGQNISLLVGFLAGLEQFFGYKFKLYLTIVICLFYISVFTGEPPILRASIMAILTSASVFFNKQTHSLYILFLTSSLILVWQPNWINSLSFWLSVSATAGILYLYPRLRNKYKQPYLTTFFVSLSAQAFTTPILLLAFREISLLSLPMNVLLAWLIEPIMFLGVLLSLIGLVFNPVAQLIAIPLFGILKIFVGLVKFGYQIGQYLIIKI